MVSVLAIAHIILSVFLIVLVLIQDPKGGAAGGMFGGGGGSNSLFGATGAPSFLARLTRWVAVIFAASCIAMTIFIKPKSDSVLDSLPVTTQPKLEELDSDVAIPQETPAPESKQD
ncbi:MAG: preprotein translocase subunit SecG [Gammaproteobacteria bacterium CG22_combo_CG10-13_8_21_14_all_40_8]|nr:MAG: preprotein translocase subunit SecG [Gammaproteobacteria bacterium CG22_combo_CG10-13_8_21_14_all_40_8]